MPKLWVVWSGIVFLVVMAAVQWSLRASQAHRPALNAALRDSSPKPVRPREHIADIPRSLWIEENKPITPDMFTRSDHPPVGLPNLNDAARDILEDMSGVWTDGSMVLSIDARRLKGSLTDPATRAWKDIVVRDVSGSMIVLDIGTNRLIVLRRPGSLSISGALLPTALELRRQ